MVLVFSSTNLSLSYLHLFLTFLCLNHPVWLKLPHTRLSVFNICRPPPSATCRVPFSKFLDEFSSFLSLAATTAHEFIITGDFNIHLDNPTDALTSQFLSVLSSFSLTQHVDFPTHDPPSHTHYFVPGPKLTFSTNFFHHSLLAPIWIAFSDYKWTRITLLNDFSFLVIFLSFYFGSCGRLSWLNCQLSSAR